MHKTQRLLTRRDFIRGTVGATLTASIIGIPWGSSSRANAARTSLVAVVRDQNVMDAAFKVDSGILHTMLEQTVLQVTGKDKIREAWAELVRPDDIVGLVPTPHLNPTHTELVDVVETVCLRILTEKRRALRGEPWPISPPPICVEAADKIYGLGTSKMEEIKIVPMGWEEDLLLG